MKLRQQTIFDQRERKFVGYCDGGNLIDLETDDLGDENKATQALVYMASAVNDNFQLPLAYVFIKSITGEQKKTILTQVIEELLKNDVLVTNVTFDGHSTNIAMCNRFGAKLSVLKDDLNPSFLVNGHKVNVILDSCHMDKLVRNTLATFGKLFDEHDNEIRWKYFVELVRFSSDRGFSLTHKMTKRHIQWWQKEMKVHLAVETFSKSTADSMQYLMENGYPEFENAEPTIRFTLIFDRLFDIFNSREDKNDDIFKNTLSNQNANEIFEFFATTTTYIKGLKIIEDGVKIPVCRSRRQTGFNGFLINMVSLEAMYREYVEILQLISNLPTYSLSQDHLEILFGKLRSLLGCNDNPSCYIFTPLLRKLLANCTVIYSKSANCRILNSASITNPYSNLLYVTSRRSTVAGIESGGDWCISGEDIEQMYERLAKIEEFERTNHLTEDLSHFTVAQIANIIERKVMNAPQFRCDLCKLVFTENTQKVENVYLSSTYRQKPCRSTFQICIEAERFLKVKLLRGSVNFNVVYHEILECLNIESLFSQTDFSEHFDHKIFLIRFIVDEYIKIKGTYIAKMSTLKQKSQDSRSRLHKLIHFYE